LFGIKGLKKDCYRLKDTKFLSDVLTSVEIGCVTEAVDSADDINIRNLCSFRNAFIA
jgi:hypothetical protein